MRGSIASGGGSGLFLSGVVKLSQLRMSLLNLKVGGWLWLTGTSVSKAD